MPEPKRELEPHEKLLEGMRNLTTASYISRELEKMRENPREEELRNLGKAFHDFNSTYKLTHQSVKEFLGKKGRKAPPLWPERSKETFKNIQKLRNSIREKRKKITVREALLDLSLLAQHESDLLIDEGLKEQEEETPKKIAEIIRTLSAGSARKRRVEWIRERLGKRTPVRRITTRKGALEDLDKRKGRLSEHQKKLIDNILSGILVRHQ